MRSTPKYLLHARPFGQLDRASAARRTVERSLGLRPPGAHRPVGFVGGLEVKGLYSGRQSHSVFYWMSIHILLTDNKKAFGAQAWCSITGLRRVLQPMEQKRVEPVRCVERDPVACALYYLVSPRRLYVRA
jgi:hypothetical protein